MLLLFHLLSEYMHGGLSLHGLLITMPLSENQGLEPYPKDTAALKIPRIANLLCVVSLLVTSLLSRSDLLSWAPLCGCHLPEFCSKIITA